MKRLVRMTAVALPLAAFLAATVTADVKTRERSSVKFESRLLNMFLGKAAKDGVVNTAAVKGNRKATMSESTGQIIDLSEEKVYDLDIKKKQYTVTTFDEIRRRMREAQEKMAKESEKAEPGERQEQKPQKEYEVDFDVKETGQKKQIAGYDAKQAIVTITVREKNHTLDEGGGMVMTNDMWLGPKVPQMKELADFDMRYWKQLQGSNGGMLSAEQMASVLAMFPLIAKANERMQKDADKLSGTPLETTTTFEAVKSKDQMTQAQEQQKSSGGGGFGGMLAKKIMKSEPPKQRSTVMTLRHEVLEIGTSVAATDLAIPADFKEKK